MADFLFQMMQIQFWQISLLFVIVFSLSALLRTRRPHLAILLWVLFFIKCLMPPVAHSPIGLFAWYKMDSAAQTEQSAPDPNDSRLSFDSSETNSPEIFFDQIDEKLAEADSNRNARFAPLDLATIFVSLWAAGVLVSLVLASTYYWSIRRKIYRQQVAVPGEIVTVANSYAVAVGIPKSQLDVVVSRSSIGPLVFGFSRPTVVIPESLMDSNVSMNPVLAHEICHIWRRDHWLGLLQLATQIIFWFHPLVWLASRQVNRLCEICCDDDTIRIFDFKSKFYANGLLNILDLQRVLQPVRMVPGIRPVEITKQRIRSIIERKRIGGFRRSHVVVMCLLLALTLPASANQNWAIGFHQDYFLNSKASPENENELMASEDIVIRRRQMNGLLGKWKAKDASGIVVGESQFTLEKSGNMLKEDWIESSGNTAQGITYFDPHQKCWRMTWINSRGMITESNGVWENDEIAMRGKTTDSEGRTSLNQMTLRIVSKNEFQVLFRSFDSEKNKWKPALMTFYYRQR